MITVTLESGKVYFTHTVTCDLTDAEAQVTLLNFSINDKIFDIQLVNNGPPDRFVKVYERNGSADRILGADPGRPYNKNCFLASHNAFANIPSMFYFANQVSDIETQLANGVTTLLLDVWLIDGTIYLLHDWNEMDPMLKKLWIGFLLNPPRPYLPTLRLALQGIAEALTRFPDMVLTLVIQDELPPGPDAQALLQADFIATNLWSKIYVPPETLKNKGVDWPTLKELLATPATPLIVFSSRRKGIFPYQWSFMDENVYGDDSVNQNGGLWVAKRSQSDTLNTHSCLAMNHFKTYAPISFPMLTLMPSMSVNGLDFLISHVEDLARKALRYPNWINLDFVEYGDGKEVVRYCKEVASDESAQCQTA